MGQHVSCRKSILRLEKSCWMILLTMKWCILPGRSKTRQSLISVKSPKNGLNLLVDAPNPLSKYGMGGRAWLRSRLSYRCLGNLSTRIWLACGVYSSTIKKCTLFRNQPPKNSALIVLMRSLTSAGIQKSIIDMHSNRWPRKTKMRFKRESNGKILGRKFRKSLPQLYSTTLIN